MRVSTETHGSPYYKRTFDHVSIITIDLSEGETLEIKHLTDTDEIVIIRNSAQVGDDFLPEAIFSIFLSTTEAT